MYNEVHSLNVNIYIQVEISWEAFPLQVDFRPPHTALNKIHLRNHQSYIYNSVFQTRQVLKHMFININFIYLRFLLTVKT